MRSLSGNYRQFVNVKDIEVCKVLDRIEDFPMFAGMVEWYNALSKGLIHKCPYVNKTMTLTNVTLMDRKFGDKRWVRLPNGLYKNTMGLSDDYDENIGEITVYHENSFHFSILEL